MLAEEPMRRVAAIYDIHGNLPALEAVVEEILAADVDLVVVGGDVFPGPMSCESLDLLLGLDLPTQFILGNGDREVLSLLRGGDTTAPEPYRELMRWAARQLSPGQERVVAGWSKTLQVDVRGLGSVLFCHATPQSDVEIFTRLTPESELMPWFADLETELVVCGHTHMQFDRTVGRVRVVNAGSVGMPFGEPGAYWLLLGPGVELRRSAYDLQQAAQLIRSTSYPQAEDFAVRNIFQPPTEQEMLDTFRASVSHKR